MEKNQRLLNSAFSTDMLCNSRPVDCVVPEARESRCHQLHQPCRTAASSSNQVGGLAIILPEQAHAHLHSRQLLNELNLTQVEVRVVESSRSQSAVLCV